MKRMKFLLGTLLSGMFMLTLTSCDKEDNNTPPPGISQEVWNEFNKLYPGAENVDWETKGNYAVASFYWNKSRAGKEDNTTAWFELTSAKLTMEEYEIGFSELPVAVKTGFEATKYFKEGWKHDDEVDVLKRDAENFLLYVIEVEKADIEYDLYFSAEGTLIKEVLDEDDKDNDYTDLLPSKPADEVVKWIQNKYPNAKIVDIDFEKEGIEVEFVLDGKKCEVLLSNNMEHISTKIDYGKNAPEAIAEYLRRKYPDYLIDDVEYIETSGKAYYEVEIEKNDGPDQTLYFDSEYKYKSRIFEIDESELPYNAKQYLSTNGYTYDDVKLLCVAKESGGEDIFYIVEAEKGNEDYILKFDEKGNLSKN